MSSPSSVPTPHKAHLGVGVGLGYHSRPYIYCEPETEWSPRLEDVRVWPGPDPSLFRALSRTLRFRGDRVSIRSTEVTGSARRFSVSTVTIVVSCASSPMGVSLPFSLESPRLTVLSSQVVTTPDVNKGFKVSNFDLTGTIIILNPGNPPLIRSALLGSTYPKLGNIFSNFLTQRKEDEKVVHPPTLQVP